MGRTARRWWSGDEVAGSRLSDAELSRFQAAGVHHICNQPIHIDALAPMGALVVFLLVHNETPLRSGIAWITAVLGTRIAVVLSARRLARLADVRSGWQRPLHLACHTVHAAIWGLMLFILPVTNPRYETIVLLCVVVVAVLGLFSSPGYFLIGAVFAATIWVEAMLWCLLQGTSWGYTTAIGFTMVLSAAAQFARQADLAFRRAILGHIENARLVNELQVAREMTQAANDELRRRNETLDTLAHRDHLTGLANRRHFLELLERSSGERGRDGWFLTILDADFFKRINDNYGHPAGDRVLKAIGEAAGAHVRRNDCLARIGGEEFGLILRDVDLETAVAIVERIRSAVGAIDAGVGPISLSAGMVQGGTHLTSELAMIRADAALYKAKQSGRDRLICDQPRGAVTATQN